MQLDLKDLRGHYASLSDEALLEIDRADLVEAARKCYDAELASRGLETEQIGVPVRTRQSLAQETTEEDDGAAEEEIVDFDSERRPDWLEDAADVITYEARPGTDRAADAASARDLLEAAGIPAYVAVRRVQPEPVIDPPPYHEYCVMVPGQLQLPATSVLDKELFNPEVIGQWQRYFESLPDKELQAVKLDELFVGMIDRLARAKKAYADEVARRGNG